jgi:type IV secretory pathway VirB6-like protein
MHKTILLQILKKILYPYTSLINSIIKPFKCDGIFIKFKPNLKFNLNLIFCLLLVFISCLTPVQSYSDEFYDDIRDYDNNFTRCTENRNTDKYCYNNKYEENRCNVGELKFDPLGTNPDLNWVLDNEACLAYQVSIGVAVTGANVAGSIACASPTGAPRTLAAKAAGAFISFIAAAIALEQAALCASTRNVACCVAAAVSAGVIASSVGILATMWDIANQSFKSTEICGETKWNQWKKRKPSSSGAIIDADINDPDAYWEKVNGKYKECLDYNFLGKGTCSGYTINNSKSLDNKNWREFIYQGVEFKDEDGCNNPPNWVSDANNKEFYNQNKQNYYMRGSDNYPNYACQRYLKDSDDQEIKKAYDCCVKRSQNAICVDGGSEGGGNHSFCEVGSICSYNAKNSAFPSGISTKFKPYFSKKTQGSVCAGTFSYCPYNFTIGGGTEIAYIDKGNKESRKTNFCQYYRHCSKIPAIPSFTIAEYGDAYISGACRDMKGDSQNTYGSAQQLIPINTKHFSAPIVQCFKETIENHFLNISGITVCQNSTDKPNSSGVCSSGYLYKKGESIPGGDSPFIKIRNKLQTFLKLCMILSLILFGFGVLIALPGSVERKVLINYIIKIGLVAYFALGNAWQAGFAKGVMNVSSSLGDVFFKLDQSKPTNKNDGCNFPRYNFADTNEATRYDNPNYPENKNYLKVWDTLDCKIAMAIGFGPETSIPNLFLIIVGAIFSVPFGIFFFLLGFAFAFFLLTITMKAMHIFIMSVISIIILLYISPVVIILSLFEKTKNVFDNWWKQILGYSIQPVMIIAYLALTISVFDKTLIGDATFVGSKDPNTLVSDEYGRKMPKIISCSGNANSTSIYCIFRISEIKQNPGLLAIGVYIPMLADLNDTKLKAILKSLIVLFVFSKFIDQIGIVGSKLVGGTPLKGESLNLRGYMSSGLTAVREVGKSALVSYAKSGISKAAGISGTIRSLVNSGRQISSRLRGDDNNADMAGNSSGSINDMAGQSVGGSADLASGLGSTNAGNQNSADALAGGSSGQKSGSGDKDSGSSSENQDGSNNQSKGNTESSSLRSSSALQNARNAMKAISGMKGSNKDDKDSKISEASEQQKTDGPSKSDNEARPDMSDAPDLESIQNKDGQSGETAPPSQEGSEVKSPDSGSNKTEEGQQDDSSPESGGDENSTDNEGDQGQSREDMSNAPDLEQNSESDSNESEATKSQQDQSTPPSLPSSENQNGSEDNVDNKTEDSEVNQNETGGQESQTQESQAQQNSSQILSQSLSLSDNSSTSSPLSGISSQSQQSESSNQNQNIIKPKSDENTEQPKEEDESSENQNNNAILPDGLEERLQQVLKRGKRRRDSSKSPQPDNHDSENQPEDLNDSNQDSSENRESLKDNIDDDSSNEINGEENDAPENQPKTGDQPQIKKNQSESSDDSENNLTEDRDKEGLEDQIEDESLEQQDDKDDSDDYKSDESSEQQDGEDGADESDDSGGTDNNDGTDDQNQKPEEIKEVNDSSVERDDPYSDEEFESEETDSEAEEITEDSGLSKNETQEQDSTGDDIERTQGNEENSIISETKEESSSTEIQDGKGQISTESTSEEQDKKNVIDQITTDVSNSSQTRADLSSNHQETSESDKSAVKHKRRFQTRKRSTPTAESRLDYVPQRLKFKEKSKVEDVSNRGAMKPTPINQRNSTADQEAVVKKPTVLSKETADRLGIRTGEEAKKFDIIRISNQQNSKEIRKSQEELIARQNKNLSRKLRAVESNIDNKSSKTPEELRIAYSELSQIKREEKGVANRFTKNTTRVDQTKPTQDTKIKKPSPILSKETVRIRIGEEAKKFNAQEMNSREDYKVIRQSQQSLLNRENKALGRKIRDAGSLIDNRSSKAIEQLREASAELSQISREKRTYEIKQENIDRDRKLQDVQAKIDTGQRAPRTTGNNARNPKKN